MHDRQPDPADPGARRGRLRDPPARGAAPGQPDRPGDHVAGHPRPDDHHEAADGGHDRGRDRVDGGGPQGRRRGPRWIGTTGSPRPRPTRAPPCEPPRTRPPVSIDPPPGHDRPRRRSSPMSPASTTSSRPSSPGPRRRTDPDAHPPARPGAGPARAGRRGLPAPEDTRAELAGARELRESDADEDIRAMAREEVERLEADETRLLEELKVLLLPRDPDDDRDVILEIRAGAGGEEAALFAAELLRMYLRYADRHRYRPEVMSLNETGIGGVKEAIVEIQRRRRVLAASSSRAATTASSGSRPRSPRAGSTPRRRRSSSCPRPRRSRSRSTRRRTSGSTSSARPGRAASRSTRPTRPSGSPTSRPASSSRSRTRRASTRTRPRRWPCCARASRTPRSGASARPTRWRGGR